MTDPERSHGMIAAREFCQLQVDDLLKKLHVAKGEGIRIPNVPMRWHHQDEQPQPTEVYLSQKLVSFTSEPLPNGVSLFENYIFAKDNNIYYNEGTYADIGFDYGKPANKKIPNAVQDTTIVNMSDSDQQITEEEGIQDPEALEPLKFRLSQTADHISS